ncbi:hypothetical protein [Flectobacillus rivi]|uniref:Site-specific DNA-methyltransferase (adenine-specific) n=1 Tax=Flectobacillus rivi TaxID=2984209 RepID=A0ABT6Z1M9_9BACT|nr:hypothetical protein [Flectobacillus rivi]MDI9875014.1 hypothetical protein [Flectobacillus rivi]
MKTSSIFKTPTKHDRIIHENPNIQQLASLIASQYIPQAKVQTKAFANRFKYNTHRESIRRLHDFCRKEFLYKYDGYPDSAEIIRLPNASWADRHTGIDCEDFVIFLGGALLNLRIPFKVRLATYPSQNTSHIYLVILLDKPLILDPCNPVFNSEEAGIFTDFEVSSHLQGIGKLVIDNSSLYVNAIASRLKDGQKDNKVTSQKLASQFGITNQSEVKELTELAIVRTAREYAHANTSILERYLSIVNLYKNQVRLNHRTSESVMLQQYSTPAPIAFLMGIWCGIDNPNKQGFEPSAGNGLLTIAAEPRQFIVNEISELRYKNLLTQGFKLVTKNDASLKMPEYQRSFDAVISNPPFGLLPQRVNVGPIRVHKLDHLMALYALETMKPAGKAAFILGGHTHYNAQGLIAGRNRGNHAVGDRFFFNYLHHYYNVVDVISIDGELYARQGTQFDVRVVLVDGVKKEPSGFAPMAEDVNQTVVETFDALYERIMTTYQKAERKPHELLKIKLQLLKLKALALAI